MGNTRGAKPKEKSENYEAVKAEWENGIITTKEASQLCGVSYVTFRKWIFQDNSEATQKQRPFIPRIQQPDNYEAVKTDYIEGKITAKQAAELLGISYNTFVRWMRIDDPEAVQKNRGNRHFIPSTEKPQPPRSVSIRPTPWVNRASRDNIVSLTKEQIAATNRVLDTVRDADFDDTERLAQIISDMSAYCHRYDPPTPDQLLTEWIEKDGYELTEKEMTFAKDVAIYILSKPRIHRLLEYKLEVLEGARRYMKENRYLLDTSMTA